MVDEELGITEADLSGPRIDRRTAVKLLSVAGVTGLAGCMGGGDDPATTTADDATTDGTDGTTTDDSDDGSGRQGEQYGGTLEAAWLASQFESLDPHFTTLSQVQWMIENVFSGVLEFAPDFSIQGDLAKDWTVEDGGRRMTFQLVENATFHNGDAFTAEDVRYSINRLFAEESPHRSNLAALKPVDEGGVEVLGDYEIRLELDSAFVPALTNLTVFNWTGAVVSQSAIEEMGAEEYNLNPVGTGPFEVTEHDLGSVLRVEAHEGYHRTLDGDQLPYLDAIEFYPINDPSSRINALRSGDANFVEFLPKTRAGEVDAMDGITVDTTTTNSYGGIGINTNAEPFTSKQVRQAVAKAVDETAFVEKAMGGYASPGAEMFSPSLGWLAREEFGGDGIGGPRKSPVQQYAPGEAASLAEEAGATDESVSIITPPPSVRWARVVKPMIEDALGWTVEVELLDYSALFPQVEGGDFQMLMWGGGGPEPDFIYEDFGPVGGETRNYYGFETQEYLDLLEQQRRTSPRTGDERKEILWRIEDILIENVPFVFCSHRDQVVARTEQLQGLELMADNRRFRNVSLQG